MARELFENTQALFDKLVAENPALEWRLRRLIRLVLMDIRNNQNLIMADMEAIATEEYLGNIESRSITDGQVNREGEGVAG